MAASIRKFFTLHTTWVRYYSSTWRPFSHVSHTLAIARPLSRLPLLPVCVSQMRKWSVSKWSSVQPDGMWTMKKIVKLKMVQPTWWAWRNNRTGCNKIPSEGAWNVQNNVFHVNQIRQLHFSYDGISWSADRIVLSSPIDGPSRIFFFLLICIFGHFFLAALIKQIV